MSIQADNRLLLYCAKCDRILASIPTRPSSGEFPVRFYVAPCAGCKADREFLQEISKPITERAGG